MAPKRARTTRANPNSTRTTTVTEPMTQEAINNLIAQRVTEALVEYETQRNSVVNGDTSYTTGTGPRTVHPTRECTYKDYLNCGPLKFTGTEGVIGLTRWFERTESVSNISNCTTENQVKFASYTLIGSALTWWNSHMRAISQEAAYAMPWKTLRQMITVKYWPRDMAPLPPRNQRHHGFVIRDFMRGAPSYTYIKDPVQRLCQRLISYNISGRGQAPEKMTTTHLFYLRSMDRGTANVLQHVAAAGAPKAAEDAPAVDEGAQADLAPARIRRIFLNGYGVLVVRIVRNKQEKDKIGTKPDQIKKKREAWRSLEKSRVVSVDRAKLIMKRGLT
nr:hypothetical protein [Tanacetum cinerariifolium]